MHQTDPGFQTFNWWMRVYTFWYNCFYWKTCRCTVANFWMHLIFLQTLCFAGTCYNFPHSEQCRLLDLSGFLEKMQLLFSGYIALLAAIRFGYCFLYCFLCGSHVTFLMGFDKLNGNQFCPQTTTVHGLWIDKFDQGSFWTCSWCWLWLSQPIWFKIVMYLLHHAVVIVTGWEYWGSIRPKEKQVCFLWRVRCA